MATLPWTTTDVAPDPGSEAVVLGSRLELRSLRDVPAFVGAAMKLRKQVREMPGALGVSLNAAPSRKTFWTFTTWTVNVAQLPESRSNAKQLWSEAKQRLAPTTEGARNVY